MPRFIRFLLPATLAVASAVGVTVTTARALEIKLPAETVRFTESSLPGYALANAMCSTCHSADYVRMQPHSFTATFWKAEVAKMKKTYGAPIPDEALEPIAEYFAKTYGADRAPTEKKAEPPSHATTPTAPNSK